MVEPINPVTFTGTIQRGGEEIKLSLGRLNIGTKDRETVPDGMHRLQGPEVVKKYMTCVMWREEGGETKLIGTAVFDEDHFIQGLQHLFPKGELNS